MLEGSWKTSVLGWLVLIGSVISGGIGLLDSDPATTFNINEIITAMGGVGLIAARDDKVTSKEAGAEK